MKWLNLKGPENLESPAHSSDALQSINKKMDSCIQILGQASEKNSSDETLNELCNLFEPFDRENTEEQLRPELLYFGPYDETLSNKAIQIVELLTVIEDRFSILTNDWMPLLLRMELDDFLYPHLLYFVDRFTTQELHPLESPPAAAIRFPISKWLPFVRDMNPFQLQNNFSFSKTLMDTRKSWELDSYFKAFSVTNALLIPNLGPPIFYELFQENRMLPIANEMKSDIIVIDWNSPLRSNKSIRGSSRRPFDLRYIAQGKEIDLTSKVINNILNRAVVWKLFRIIDINIRTIKGAQIKGIRIKKDDIANPRILFMASQLRQIFFEIGKNEAIEVMPLNRKTGVLEINFHIPILLIGKPPVTFYERRRVKPSRKLISKITR